VLEECAATLYELGVGVVRHLHVRHVDADRDLFGDGWDVAAGPPLAKRLLERLELVKASLAAPLAFRVASSHRVLHHFVYFDGVADREDRSHLLALIFVVFDRVFSLLALLVERQNLSNQIRFGHLRPSVQVLAAPSATTVLVTMVQASRC